MQKFKLEVLLHIIGIGSASGLVLKNNMLFIISDNSSSLYQYKIKENELITIPLLENAQGNMAKKDKPDLEAITEKGGLLYLFGSGSTEKRNRCFTYNLITGHVVTQDLQPLFDKLKKTAAITSTDLNIEGAVWYNNSWLLFQRGNGEKAKNGVFVVDEKANKKKFHPITLPKIQNIEATFTDAVLVKDQVYFLAAVENTVSTYDDGDILGSFIGIINLLTMTVIYTEFISATNKFEGLAFSTENEEEISFLLCEDNDTETLETTIYNLTLKK
ncbi:MAG TPA: hypothetical protein VF677_00215 [Flavobacterium sp.]|jgi:hypothetical protein